MSHFTLENTSVPKQFQETVSQSIFYYMHVFKFIFFFLYCVNLICVTYKTTLFILEVYLIILAHVYRKSVCKLLQRVRFLYKNVAEFLY